jgi:hypothetical protein
MEGRLTEPNSRGRYAMVRRCSRGSRLLGRVEMELDEGGREGGREMRRDPLFTEARMSWVVL